MRQIAAFLCPSGLPVQAYGLAHWSGGDAIVSPDEPAEHAALCHGNTSTFGGGSAAFADAAPGTTERPPVGLQTSHSARPTNDVSRSELFHDAPDDPPRRGFA